MSYVGVTGVTDHAQVRRAIANIPVGITRDVMIGVLASFKTIQGLPAGNPNRYPLRCAIRDIFIPDIRCINLVHYDTREQSELAKQLVDAMVYGGPACHGLQLNIVWPDPAALVEFRRRKPEAILVLQISRDAMLECQNSAERVAERVCASYGALVNYVLVDASCGRGVPLNPVHAAAYLVEIGCAREMHLQTFSLLVSGGLCADNLRSLVTPLRMLIPEVGTDAENALRTDDMLDDGKVARYLQAAYEFFR